MGDLSHFGVREVFLDKVKLKQKLGGVWQQSVPGAAAGAAGAKALRLEGGWQQEWR